MAIDPQVRGEGELIAGLGTSGIIPERFMVRGMDRLGQMSFITRGTNRFLSLMHMRYSKPKTVETREYKTYEMTELDRTIPVRVASTSADGHTTVGVDNYVAAQFQASDMYHVKGLYCAIKTQNLVAGQVLPGTNAVPATNKPPHLGYSVGGQPESVHYSSLFGMDAVDNTLFFTDYEQMIVVDVGASDSAGTGYTKVRFVRCFRGPGARDMGGMMLGRHAPSLVSAGIAAGGESGAITTNMTLLRALPSFAEGTGAPTGFHKNPVIDVNFSQLFKYSVEITKESTIEKTYMGKSQLEVNKMLRMAQMTLDMERSFLCNQKGKTNTDDGKALYTMGGALEWVPKDTDHVIKYNDPQITYPGLLRLGDKVMALGGSESRDFYCGLELYTELKIAFYDSGYLRYDEDASAQFDLPVESIVVAGGKWQIHPLYSLSEIGMGNKALIVDNKLPTFTPVTHSGWDMIAEKDIQNKGENVYKELWQGIKGLDRRYSQYLTLVEFPI